MTSLRQTFGAKIVAIGFIILTLLGNYWLVDAIFETLLQPWMGAAFYSCVGVVAIGALCMCIELAMAARSPASNEDDVDTP